MQATSSSFRALPRRRTGLILAAIVLAVTALASVAALLDPPKNPSWAKSAGSGSAIGATVPVGIVGDSAVAGDPSVPSAASVFKDKSALPEEPVDGF